MNFCSDNTAGTSPEIMESLIKANNDYVMPYGADDLTLKVEQKLADIFETDVTCFLVATGTASNALALSTLTPPYGEIYCHREAHINVDECGAPEFFTNGAKLVTLPGQHGKLHPGDLSAALAMASDAVHHTQPAALSLSQSTECGTVYGPSEVHNLCDIAKEHGLYTHMDGARFANALVTLDCAPAEITWKAGIDVLSFGATKNGAMAAEAVIFFNKKLGRDFGYRRKRGGHLVSKGRYIAAQMNAYLEHDLWLRNARHANEMCKRLKDGLLPIAGDQIHHPVEANAMFISLPEPVLEGLEAAGFKFYRWLDANSPLIRLVTSFNTRMEDVDAFVKTAQDLAKDA